MVGYLEGKVLSKNPDSHQCILLCGQVGYELSIHVRLYEMLEIDQSTSLWIHTVMRETALSLFAFSTETEKHFFKLLLGVNGLGPRTAMALLGQHGAELLANYIIEKQADKIATAPGVGKKTAQRIVVDLGTKLEKWTWFEKIKLSSTKPLSGEPVKHSKTQTLKEDLTSALQHLGYQPNQIRTTIEKTFSDDQEIENLGFEQSLKAALKQISLGY